MALAARSSTEVPPWTGLPRQEALGRPQAAAPVPAPALCLWPHPLAVGGMRAPLLLEAPFLPSTPLSFKLFKVQRAGHALQAFPWDPRQTVTLLSACPRASPGYLSPHGTSVNWRHVLGSLSTSCGQDPWLTRPCTPNT